MPELPTENPLDDAITQAVADWHAAMPFPPKCLTRFAIALRRIVRSQRPDASPKLVAEAADRILANDHAFPTIARILEAMDKAQPAQTVVYKIAGDDTR